MESLKHIQYTSQNALMLANQNQHIHRKKILNFLNGKESRPETWPDTLFVDEMKALQF